MKKLPAFLAGIVGVVLVVLAFIYWSTPANALPSFLPGYSPALTTVHFKHGLGCFILALGAFAYTWFSTGKKSNG